MSQGSQVEALKAWIKTLEHPQHCLRYVQQTVLNREFGTLREKLVFLAEHNVPVIWELDAKGKKDLSGTYRTFCRALSVAVRECFPGKS